MRKLGDIGRILLLGVSLGIIYFSIDIVIDTYYFGNGDILEETFQPSAHESVDRSLVLLILVAFTFAGQSLYSRIRQAREALGASEKQIREISAAMGEGVYVLDKEARLIFMNPAAERLWGWSEDELRGRNVHDLIHYQHANGTPYPAAECPTLGVFRTKKPFRTESDVFVRKDGAIFPVSYIAAPIIQDGRVVAAVSVFQDISQRKEAEMLSDALDDVNEIIHSTLDFDEIMQLVKEEMALEMGCDAAAITLRREDQWVMQYLHGLPERFTGEILAGRRATHLNMISSTRKPVLILDARKDERIDPGLAHELGIRSMLSVPLVVKENVIGDISFIYLARKSAFSQAQLDFGTKAAAAVSLAIENARLYDIERNIAHTLQQAILTLPDAIPGLEIGHLYRSATETLEVGGDFYDLFELEHDKVGITIGDISGKGLEAAALTSLIKNSVKAYAHVYDSPAAILEQTNHLVVDATEDYVFATLFFAILNIENGRLTWCRAGHPSPIVSGSAESQLIMDGSPPVGIYHDLEFYEHTQVLERGDTLLLYTDGVIEAKQGDLLFGETRLVQTVERLRGTATRDLPDGIFRAVSEFTGGRLPDDIALLAVTIGK